MPLKPDGDKVTVSLVLWRTQAAQMRALQVLWKQDGRDVSMADVGREVVAAGLRSLSQAPLSTTASIESAPSATGRAA